jgi:fluoride exporter
MTWLVLTVAGGLGAVGRVAVNHLVTARVRPPAGILVVNVTGSLVAGAIAGAAADGLLAAPTARVALVGFLGAYTTFATAILDVLGLADDARPAAAVALAVLTLTGSVGAALLGLALFG